MLKENNIYRITAIFLILVSMILFSCSSGLRTPMQYKSDNLSIEKIGENVWQHISYLDIPNYGQFPCNGMVYFSGDEAVIVDTPIDSKASEEIIAWVQDTLGYKISAVIVNHFHGDCLGGLKAFHDIGIDSYGSDKTLELASLNSDNEIPKISFDKELKIVLDGNEIITRYFGAGHTTDNTVTYIPNEEILFGGCLIKAIGAGKGNLEDADTNQWSGTVRKIKARYPNLNIVIPGHGKAGGIELLEYTIKMFDPEK